MAILRATAPTGDITITATVDGVPPATLKSKSRSHQTTHHPEELLACFNVITTRGRPECSD